MVPCSKAYTLFELGPNWTLAFFEIFQCRHTQSKHHSLLYTLLLLAFPYHHLLDGMRNGRHSKRSKSSPQTPAHLCIGAGGWCKSLCSLNAWWSVGNCAERKPTPQCTAVVACAKALLWQLLVLNTSPYSCCYFRVPLDVHKRLPRLIYYYYRHHFLPRFIRAQLWNLFYPSQSFTATTQGKCEYPFSLKASFSILIMEKIQFNLQLVPKDFTVCDTFNVMEKRKMVHLLSWKKWAVKDLIVFSKEMQVRYIQNRCRDWSALFLMGCFTTQRIVVIKVTAQGKLQLLPF